MQELYNEAVKIINQLIRSCKDAAALCQQWYFNGHKRYYQAAALCYMNKLLYLKKKVFDNYHFMPVDDNASMPYRANSYKGHFEAWKSFLTDSINDLSTISKKLYAETGIENCTLTKIICKLYKDQERTIRQMEQYDESGWNPIELHAMDEKLHCKMKKKMKKEGIK